MSGAPASKFTQIRQRLDAAGIAHMEGLDFFDEPELRIDMPCGRDTRPVHLELSNADKFEAIGFENIRFLEGLWAIIDGDNEIVEGRIRGFGRPSSLASLRYIPGAEPISSRTADLEDEDSEGSHLRVDGVRVRVEDPKLGWIELSPISPTLAALTGMSGPGGYSIKTPCGPGISHDDAKELLESRAHSLMFDLDLRYSVPLELVPYRRHRRRRPVTRLTEAPTFPANRYASEPLALYRYGRSAQGLPLLEFLAYYQAIEYFFPYYSGIAAIGAVRTELLDPRFQVGDDGAVARLIALTRSSTRGSMSEKDQLRATLSECTDEVWLETHITADTQTRDHFCANKQALSGVRKIQLGGSVDLRHQVADRIYEIRCRIVHAKQDGGDSGVELLLPSSDEAAALDPDIALTRAIAQRAIIARAQLLA
ncbi:hypothetical protein [Cellulomonas iranensis]|uniref:hypothetical protein n=1 Tax=Cellulomonas iranensis TaxID=76862 RepID=UPI0013D162BE|nr:hypothetical protein [Cellulomonas iranensis]